MTNKQQMILFRMTATGWIGPLLNPGTS